MHRVAYLCKCRVHVRCAGVDKQNRVMRVRGGAEKYYLHLMDMVVIVVRSEIRLGSEDPGNL